MADDNGARTGESVRTGGRASTYARGDAAKRRILDIATEEFAARGYWGASLQDIAGRTGMSKPGLLHHFPSKQALLAAVLAERDLRDRYGMGVDDIFALRGLQVLDMLDRLVVRNAERSGLVQLSHVLAAESAGGDHPAAETGRRHFMEARTLVRTALEAGIADGELRADLDCGLLATQIVAVMEGLENQWLADPGQVDLMGVFHAYTRDLRERIRATP
ncbi:TetR family transcriptional regulator [Streptomyces hokutonensis]|uniref:TetR family transcriptional regulator n=1 Tax=Streptomyces hokutonensis TaxID=1306990 RepID=UPI0036C0C329